MLKLKSMLICFCIFIAPISYLHCERFLVPNASWTPLMRASIDGTTKYKDTFQDLIKKDSRIIDAVNDSGVTALMIASAYGQNFMVKFLLENGANIELTDKD